MYKTRSVAYLRELYKVCNYTAHSTILYALLDLLINWIRPASQCSLKQNRKCINVASVKVSRGASLFFSVQFTSITCNFAASYF